MRIVVVGGGFAGCAAAISAKKAGAQVLLLERTDMLLGTGLVGGIMRNNGRYTAAEEMIALGGGELFQICDENSRHINIDFPGHKHASLFDIALTQGATYRYLKKLDVDIKFNTRVVKVNKDNSKVVSVEDKENNVYEGDVFIDTTGTAGPIGKCTKHGNGCAMCIMRCPSFGGRVSVTALAGLEERVGMRPNGELGAMSGSCKLLKESLSEEIQQKLNNKGVVIIKIPEELIEDHLEMKACQQYALKEFKDNIILLDTGHAKLMSPYYSLCKLRKIPGFENARYEDPYAGGIGNSMRFFGVAERDNTMKVIGIDNLFCGGEKAGLLVGHTEAIVTGTLAGFNSVKFFNREELLQFPRALAVGEGIAYVKESMESEEGMSKKYTFSGSVLLERLIEKELYTVDREKIENKVNKLGLYNIFK